MAACALVTLGVLALYIVRPALLEHLERRSYDLQLQTLAHARPAHVTIAAIDERSLAELGRWPWSRATLARLTDRLRELGARVIAFDVFFPEREARGPDRGFARALARAGNAVLGTVFLLQPEEARHVDAAALQAARRAIEPQAIETVHGAGAPRVPLPEPHGVLANIPELQQAAARSGHVNVLTDPDGVVRRAPLVYRLGERYFPSFDIQVARAYLGALEVQLDLADYGIAELRIGEHAVPLDEDGRLLVRYRGSAGSFDTVSIADILAGRADAALLRGRVVLVGNTAQGIGDMRATPYGGVFPGVEIRASIIENLLQGDYLQRPEWLTLIDLAVLAVIGILLTWLLPRLGVAAGGLLALGVAGGALLAADFALRAEGLWLSAVYPGLLAALLFVATTLVFYFFAFSEKRYLKLAFQHYVPPAVVEDIVQDPGKLSLGGEKRELTVLFSDIRGFTTLSEAMAPEALVRLMNRYFTAMTGRLFEQRGSLDKFIGDAIMAVFGAPLAEPSHAEHACRAALGMMAALDELRREWQAEGLPRVDIGIGINSGPVIVGNMGSAERFNYTVVGDAVNLASRIEGLNKAYGTGILVSESTYAQIDGTLCPSREVDVLRVRGRAQPVRVYELIAEGRYATLDWLGEFRAAYAEMREGDAARAAQMFDALHERTGDRASAYHAERCRQK
jgi:adenylate cyclase